MTMPTTKKRSDASGKQQTGGCGFGDGLLLGHKLLSLRRRWFEPDVQVKPENMLVIELAVPRVPSVLGFVHLGLDSGGFKILEIPPGMAPEVVSRNADWFLVAGLPLPEHVVSKLGVDGKLHAQGVHMHVEIGRFEPGRRAVRRQHIELPLHGQKELVVAVAVVVAVVPERDVRAVPAWQVVVPASPLFKQELKVTRCPAQIVV